VPGVAVVRPSRAGAGAWEIETEAGRDVRADVARALVHAGFDLLDLHPMGMSLEEIFLQLTTSDVAAETAAPAPEPAATPEPPPAAPDEEVRS
jgi:hypothetical protein